MKIYELLGVPGDASEKQIKAAYRALAKKLHPDVGGDPEHFMRVTRAYEVLSDPERRKRYDETGKIDGGAIDNDHVEVLGLINAMMEQLATQVTSDKIYVDLVARMRENLDERVAAVKRDIETMAYDVQRLGKLAKRFKSTKADNVLRGMIENRVRQTIERQTSAQRQLDLTAKARALLDDYSFDVDAQPQSAGFGGGLWTISGVTS